MADDFDPNKYVEGFDPDAAAAPAAAAPVAEVPRTRWEHLGAAVRPDKHIAKDFMSGVKDTAQALNPWDPAEVADRNQYLKDFSEGNFNPSSLLSAAGQTPPGRGLRAAWGVGKTALSPLSGVMESVKDLGNAALPPPTPEELEQYKKEGRPSWAIPKGGGEAVESGLSAIPATRWGSWRTAGKTPPASPPPAAPNTAVLHPDDVTLSEGVISGDLPTLKREYRAAEGALGKKAEERALAHEEQRAGQLEELKGNTLESFNPPRVQGAPSNATDAAQSIADTLAQSQRTRTAGMDQRGQQLDQTYETFRERLSPTGSVLARTPDEAAQIVSQAIGAADEAAIAATNNAYAQFRALPGQFHPASFNKAADELRFRIASPENLERRLSINPESTPTAERVFNELPEIIKGITQRRDPETGRVMGGELPLTPERVELVRQWLSSERGTAMSLRDKPKDAQAMRRIIDEFDNLVARKLRTTFTGGDPAEVIRAIQEARGLYSEHRQAYHSRGSGDVVGPTIQKILGRHEGQALTPEQVSTTLYEGANSVPVARRLLEIFGDVPEVRGALKQGLLAHITEAPPGKAAYTPEQIASRIEKFTRGSGRSLTETYLSDPAEVQQLQTLGRELRQFGEARNARPNPALKILEDITGNDTRSPAGIEWAKERLFKGALSNSRDSAEVIRQLERDHGTASPLMTSYRQGQYRYALESPKRPEDPRGYKAAADNLHALANSEAGKALYNPDQRALIQATSDLYRKLVAPARGPNWSNTAAAAKPMLDKIVMAVTGVAGAYITHKVAPFMGMSELAGGYAAAKVSEAMSNVRHGKAIAKQMPLIADELVNYQRALTAHSKRNNALTRTRLGAATTSLEAATQKIGIDINRLPTPQLPAPVGAGEDETPGRAEGGGVNSPFDAPAEESKSGFWDQLSAGAATGYNVVKQALPLPIRAGVEMVQGAFSPAGREAFMEGVSKSGGAGLKSYGEAVENQYVPEGAVKYDDAGQYYDKDGKPLTSQQRRPNILPVTQTEPGQGWFGSSYEGAMPAMLDVWNTMGAPAKASATALMAAAKAGGEGKLASQAGQALRSGEQQAFHGTRFPEFDKFKVRSIAEQEEELGYGSSMNALGVHVAKDPRVSSTFAQGENGRVLELAIPKDAKFLEVPPSKSHFGSSPADETAVEELMIKHAREQHPELYATYAKNYDDAALQEIVEVFRKDMQQQGYAGLKYKNEWHEEVPEGADPTSYIVFDPSKHVRNRATGAFMSDSGGEGKLASQAAQAGREKAPAFYSAAEKFLSNTDLRQASAQQWEGLLANAKGVKPEELKWTGLEDYLKAKKASGQKVTRENLQDHITNSKIQVEEVHKSGNALTEDTLAEEADRLLRLWTESPRSYLHAEVEHTPHYPGGAWSVVDGHGNLVYTTSSEKLAKDELRTFKKAAKNGDPDDILYDWSQTAADEMLRNSDAPRHADYQTPGGENYSELLLKLPAEAKREANYTSGHWDEANVLAHVRFQTRNVGNQKTLYIDEIQSDWHQHGRKKGYRDPDAAAVEHQRLKDQLSALDDKLYNASLTKGYDESSPAITALRQQRNELDQQTARASNLRHYGVPEAPFKKSWPELAFKRMLRYAADNGYQAIAWTSGANTPTNPKMLGQFGLDAEKSDRALRNFYSNDLTNIAKKYAKQHGGEIQQRKLPHDDVDVGSVSGERLMDELGIPEAEQKTFWENLIKEPGAREKLFDEVYAKRRADREKFHFMELPEELRKQAVQEGFPLFAKLGSEGKLASQAGQKKDQVPGPVGEEQDNDAPAAQKRAAGGRVELSNIEHNPSEAQKEAGNYSKDKVHRHGLLLTIENAKGKPRSGVGPDGKPWTVMMPAHYGYVNGSVGADKDHVDVYVGPHTKAPCVYVIDQRNAETGKFDEHKAFLGFASERQALATYMKGFSDGKGPDRFSAMKRMTVPEFKEWVFSPKSTKPVAS